MPILTFAPASVPTSLFSGADPTTDALGPDHTPALWPTNGLVSSAEIEVTATTTPDMDGGLLLALLDRTTRYPVAGASTPASGVWSGATGAVGPFFNAEALALAKFGGWRTDYATHSATTSAANYLTASTTASFGPDLDMRFSIRRANWSTSANNCVWYSNSTGAGGRIVCTPTGLLFSNPTGTISHTTPWATLGATNGQWLTVRYTWSNANRLRVYVGGTMVDSNAMTGYTRTSDTIVTMRFGNGGAAGRIGLDGDLRYFEHWQAGALWQSVSLDAMAASSTTSWTPAAGVNITRTSSSLPVMTGSTIPATLRARIDFDTPWDPTIWRLVAYVTSGAYTVDEIVLDWAPPRSRGYRGIGLVRGSRG